MSHDGRSRAFAGGGERCNRGGRKDNEETASGEGNSRDRVVTMAHLRMILLLVLAVAGAFAETCNDITPDTGLDCPTLIASIGSQLCFQGWFKTGNYCKRTCGRDPCPARALDLQQGSVTLVGKRTGQQKDTSAPAAASIELPPTTAAPVFTPAPAVTEKPAEPVEVVKQPEQSSEPSCQDVASVIANRGDLSFLKEAIERTGLGGALSGFSGTIFAPTNGAFDSLLNLLDLSRDSFFAGNIEVIQQLLQIHVVPGERVSQATNKEVTSLLGGAQKIKVEGGTVTSPAGISSQIKETIDACNSVVVLVDAVIVPRPVEGVTSG